MRNKVLLNWKWRVDLRLISDRMTTNGGLSCNSSLVRLPFGLVLAARCLPLHQNRWSSHGDIDGRDEWQRLNFSGKRNGDWEIIYIFAAVKITIWWTKIVSFIVCSIFITTVSGVWSWANRCGPSFSSSCLSCLRYWSSFSFLISWKRKHRGGARPIMFRMSWSTGRNSRWQVGRKECFIIISP